MVCIDIDGIWCNKCKKMHPTLMWHIPYNDYELNRKEKWELMKKHKPELFRKAEFVDSLYFKKLKENNIEEKCYICGNLTFFSNMITGHYVCSDKCKYIDNGFIETK